MAALTVRMCGYEMTPPVDVRRGRWCSGCRGGVQSAVTSAMAVRVEDSSTMALSTANAATRGTVTFFEICSGAVDCGAMAMDQRWGVGIFRRQRRAR